MRKLVVLFMSALLIAGISSCNSKPEEKKQCDKHCAEQKMNHKKCDKEKGCCLPNVTEEQKTQFKALKDKQMAEAAPLMEALKAKKEQMCELMKAEPVDLNAVNALIDEVFVVKANLEKLEVANKIEMAKLLTPEQKAAMKEKTCCKKDGCKEGGCCKEGKHHDKDKGCCEGKKDGCKHGDKGGCDGKHDGCKDDCKKK